MAMVRVRTGQGPGPHGLVQRHPARDHLGGGAPPRHPARLRPGRAVRVPGDHRASDAVRSRHARCPSRADLPAPLEALDDRRAGRPGAGGLAPPHTGVAAPPRRLPGVGCGAGATTLAPRTSTPDSAWRRTGPTGSSSRARGRGGAATAWAPARGDDTRATAMGPGVSRSSPVSASRTRQVSTMPGGRTRRRPASTSRSPGWPSDPRLRVDGVNGVDATPFGRRMREAASMSPATRVSPRRSRLRSREPTR